MKRNELESYLNKLLNVKSYQDYGPNGLQIEGKDNIRKVALAVSATKDSISQAIDFQADAMIVHHGLFWKFHGVRTITGPFAARVKPLIENDINLFGYHLPLDAHIEHGNAAMVAKKIGLENLNPFGDYKGMPTGVYGTFKKSLKPQELKSLIKNQLGHEVLHSSPSDKEINTMAIITGGANGDWIHCLKDNIDAYLTGEMSEHDWHEAKESNVHMFAAGHNATERYGVQALMEILQKEKLDCLFIDSDNPA